MLAFASTSSRRTDVRSPGRAASTAAPLLAGDRAGDLGVAVPQLTAEARRALDAALPAVGSHQNPVDLLGDADPGRYQVALEVCLADGNVDAVLAMLAPQAQTKPVETAEAVVWASRRAARPVIACWMGEGLVHVARSILEEAGIPQFATPESAVEAIHLLASYRRSQQLLRQLPAALPPDAMPLIDVARELVGRALAKGRDALTTLELRNLLATVGVRDGAAAGESVAGTGLHLRVSRDGVFGPVLRFGLAGGATGTRSVRTRAAPRSPSWSRTSGRGRGSARGSSGCSSTSRVRAASSGSRARCWRRTPRSGRW